VSVTGSRAAAGAPVFGDGLFVLMPRLKISTTAIIDSRVGSNS
jgi:hypothetical protein